MSGVEIRPAAMRAGEHRGFTILHIITGLDLGGAELVLERLVKADTANTHIIVSLYTIGPVGRRLLDSGFDVRAVGFGQGSSWIALFKLWRTLKSVNPDLVQTWMYHANVVAGALARMTVHCPVCWNIRRTKLSRERTNFRTRVFAKIGALLSRSVPDRIICCAESAALEHIAHGYDEHRIVVIPNGIDTRRFAPDARLREQLRAELAVQDGEFLIGCVGRFHLDKDHRTLFAALRILGPKMPTLRCLLVGRGVSPSDKPITNIAASERVSERIIFLGPRDDLPAIMNALDLHVSSSITEGFPNAIAEAMASGTPCVATDAGGTSDILGKLGWIVDVQCPDQLATSIEEAVSIFGTKEWKDLQTASRDRCVRKFGLDTMVTSYRAVWLAMIGRERMTAVT